MLLNLIATVIRLYFTYLFRLILYLLLYAKQLSLIRLLLSAIGKLLMKWLTAIIVFWSAVFIYVMLYYMMIPQVLTVKDMHFKYDDNCNIMNNQRCGTVSCKVSLESKNRKIFTRGQAYKFSFELVVPEFEANMDSQMFMVKLILLDAERNIVLKEMKPASFHYKTRLLRTINTVLWSPLNGFKDESQVLRVELLKDYIEGSKSNVGPVTDALIQVEARQLHIYEPSKLIILAQLNGVQYYMYYYPVSSFCIGLCVIFLLLYLLPIYKIVIYSTSSANENDSNFY